MLLKMSSKITTGIKERYEMVQPKVGKRTCLYESLDQNESYIYKKFELTSGSRDQIINT